MEAGGQSGWIDIKGELSAVEAGREEELPHFPHFPQWKLEARGGRKEMGGHWSEPIDIGGIHRFIYCIVFGIPGIRHRRINHPMEVAISIPGLISIISPNHDLTDCK